LWSTSSRLQKVAANDAQYKLDCCNQLGPIKVSPISV
jgi:hypothetical protein